MSLMSSMWTKNNWADPKWYFSPEILNLLPTNARSYEDKDHYNGKDQRSRFQFVFQSVLSI